MQLLMLLRVISFPCISRKTSFLSSCVLILIHVTSVSETELKCSFCLGLFLKSRATQRVVAGVTLLERETVDSALGIVLRDSDPSSRGLMSHRSLREWQPSMW